MVLSSRLGTLVAVALGDCVCWAEQQVGAESGHQGQRSQRGEALSNMHRTEQNPG